MPLAAQLISLTQGPLNMPDLDPGGLESFSAELKRSKDNDGVFIEYTIDLQWNKISRNYIEKAIEEEGIESLITVNIYEYDPNAYEWPILYTGELKLSRYEIDETKATVNIEKVSFQRKFLNSLDIDVDLEATQSKAGVPLNVTPVLDLEYHPKIILKEFDASPIDENEFAIPGLAFFTFPACATPSGCDRPRDTTIYVQIDTSDAVKDELSNTFLNPWGFFETGFSAIQEVYIAAEAGTTDIDISTNLQFRVKANPTGGDFDVEGCGDNDLGKLEIKVFFEHQDKDGNSITLQQMGSDYTIPGCPGFREYTTNFETKTYQDSDVPVSVGDKFFVYATVRLFATYQQSFLAASSTVDHEFAVTADKEDTFVRFSVRTEFPASTAKSVLLYEAFNKLCQHNTDQLDVFRSNFLGRTDTEVVYSQDGEGSLIARTNGRNLRGSDNTQIFGSWNDMFQSLRAKYAVGWGFSVADNGSNIIIIEEKSFFYDKDTTVLDLGTVSNIKRKAVPDLYWAQVEIGYPKIERINQVNASDEFNTVRRFTSPNTQATGKLNLVSVDRSSGFEIESQRRLQASTEESRLDDANFMVAVIRDGINSFKTEQNENFSSITGIFDPDSVYNARISPRRSIEFWKEILASNVTRAGLINGRTIPSKNFNFSYGELNYLMQSQLTTETSPLKENDNVRLESIEAIWIPEEYEFESELSSDQFKLLQQNPYGIIKFKDWDGIEQEGFLLSCSFVFEDKKAAFKLLRVFRGTE